MFVAAPHVEAIVGLAHAEAQHGQASEAKINVEEGNDGEQPASEIIYGEWHNVEGGMHMGAQAFERDEIVDECEVAQGGDDINALCQWSLQAVGKQGIVIVVGFCVHGCIIAG